MKLPSVQLVLQQAAATLGRFPFALGAAMAGASLAIYSANLRGSEVNEYLEWILLCALGLPFFISLTLFSERRKFSLPVKGILMLGGCGLLLGYHHFFIDLSNPYLEDKTEIRSLVLNSGLHFLVAFAPFLKRGEVNGFWQYNRTLFSRFITGLFYTFVLYTGILFALLALHYLFEIYIRSMVYTQLWFFLFGIFNTWFFLAGVPKDFEALESSREYPKGLRVFVQYILVSLVLLYMTILYLYGAKILVQWELPRGWLSHLMIAFSIFGILSQLFLYPFQTQEGHHWIKTYSRWFYRLLIPLLLILFVAIGKRISDYGFTESRYILFVLSLWLACITFYFVFSSAKNIKLIPASLCLLSLLIFAGPLSVFNVPISSQARRLERLLNDNPSPRSSEVAKEIVAAAHYLREHAYPLDRFQSELEGINGDLASDLSSSGHYFSASPYGDGEGNLKILHVKNYDWIAELYWSDHDNPKIALEGDRHLIVDPKNSALSLFEGNQLKIKIDLKPKMEALVKKYKKEDHSNLDQDEMQVVAEAEGARAACFFSSLWFHEKEGLKRFGVTLLFGSP